MWLTARTKGRHFLLGPGAAGCAPAPLQTSNNRVISSGDLYCCLLPQCEALRTCRSSFPITTQEIYFLVFRMPNTGKWPEMNMCLDLDLATFQYIDGFGCYHFCLTRFGLDLITVHPRFSGPRLTGPSINRPGSTGRYIQLFSLKSTRFTVEKN